MDKIAAKNKAVNAVKRNAQIGFGSFLAMTASMVLTVYEYPSFAQGGWSLILFLMVAGLCFFLPITMAAAEMGTVRKWEKGGIYVWIRNTLGPRWGYYCIFGQWMQICIGFITMLYAIISTLAFAVGGTGGFDLLTQAGSGADIIYSPLAIANFNDGRFSDLQMYGDASTNAAAILGNTSSLSDLSTTIAPSFQDVSYYIFGVAVLIFFILTFIALFGAGWIAKFTKIGFWGGIAGPTAIIVILGIIYLAEGGHVFQTGQGTGGSAFTRGQDGVAAFTVFMAVIVAFAGPEGSANLANRLKNVGRNYPLAVILLLIMALSFSILAGIFISISTDGSVNSAGGLSISLLTLFMVDDKGMSLPMAESAARVVSFIIALGLIGEVLSWIVGPSTGMHTAAKDGIISKWFLKKNKFDIAWTVILVQTILFTIFEVLITIILGIQPGGNSFSAALQTTVLIYTVVYMLLFLGHMRMLHKAPDLPKSFSLKKWFGWIVAMIGFIYVAFAWVAAWVNFQAPAYGGDIPNYVWYPTLAVLFIFAWVFGDLLYDIKRIKYYNEIMKKYGYQKGSYIEELRGTVRKLFLLKLAEQHVEEILDSPFTEEPLTNATPEEIEEGLRLKQEEKAQNSKKVMVK